MSRRTYEPDEQTRELIVEALQARTAGIVGRPDSLAELRRASRREKASPLRRLTPAIGLLATVIAVLLVAVGVNWIGHSYSRETKPIAPAHPEAPLPKTGFGYSPTDYFPSVRSDGQPVIVWGLDGRLMRILPRGRANSSRWVPVSPMILSPDGNQVYGVARDLQEDGTPYSNNEGADHVVVIDLRTNQFTSLATRGERITGFSLSADGTTFAYSLRGSQDGLTDRDVIYVHDLVHDTDRHFSLVAGQRTVIMALSPDGSRLAINAGGKSSALQVMSTTSGIPEPPQQLLGALGCTNSIFGPVQWTSSGLYAIRSCTASGSVRMENVVRINDDPTQPSTVVAPASGGSAALVVLDSAAGPVIFTNSGTDHVVTNLVAKGQQPVDVPNIRLSGPGT